MIRDHTNPAMKHSIIVGLSHDYHYRFKPRTNNDSVGINVGSEQIYSGMPLWVMALTSIDSMTSWYQCWFRTNLQWYATMGHGFN
jgi:hypothetical protein